MDSYVIGLLAMGALFFCFCLYAWYRSAKSGQLRKLEQGARVIFTPDEPEGVILDQFPAARRK